MSRTKRPRKLGDFSTVNPAAAAIDIGATIHVAAVGPIRDQEPVRTFRTFTDDLYRLADWFAECGIRTVAMESTGVYWIPVFEILQQRGFEVIVVNARDAKHVPGRKTDVSDAQWLQRLHEYGLLRASFRPQAEIAGLRAYLRQRERLLDYTAAHIQHMQKAMMQMNLQLHHVVTDVKGLTGMSIIRAIVAGERDPNVLATHRDRRCHASVETVCQALVGNYRDEHVFALTQALELYDVYQTKVTACDEQIEAILKRLKKNAPPPAGKLLPVRKRTRQPNAPAFDARAALHAILGVDLTQITGLGPSLRAEAGRRVRDQSGGLAQRKALHVMVGACAAQQNLRRKGTVVKDAAHQQPRRVFIAARRRHGGPNRHRPGCVLPPPVGAHQESEGDHRYCTQNCRPVLQHAPPRDVLCRSRGNILRRTLPPAGPAQSATTSKVPRVRPDRRAI